MLILLLAPSQINGVFYLALALLSVKKSGLAYVEEFVRKPAVGGLEHSMYEKKKPNIAPINACWYIGWTVGAITGLVLTSNFSSKQMLMISAIVGAIGCIFFCSYSICYKVSLGHHQEYKHELKHEIRALLKLFPKLLPLWAPFLIYYMVDAAGRTFFIEQGKVSGHGGACLYMLQKIVGFMASALINLGITKFSSKRNQPKWVATVAKITCGMFICFLICLLSWHVEASRLQSIKNNQDPKIILHFAMFLQFILLETMNKMVGKMLGKFFCDYVADESMHHLEFTFNSFVEGMGRLLGVACILVFRNWIGDTINESHLDKYYRALTFISLCACVIFIILSYTCYWKKETEDHASLATKIEEVGLTSEPQSFSLHSSPQWSAQFSADESMFACSEQTSVPSNLGSARPSTNNKWVKSLTCPNRPPPAEEVSNDYRRSRSAPNNLRYRASAKASSQHSEGRLEIN
ncbi:hypothetical protein SLEP1_g37976 [Rubroshorea leprosula]|uniref:Uncharacterized protein n=1 Tax=Rubroshorea leprosula TaxID=152421 RepID=A0AAV5KWF5_9ROSI|nr:hypothetical protein SLEP1_g37976 [Rubroshorea leprosula]